MDAYFQQLNIDLKRNGEGVPQLIIDEKNLLHNLSIVQTALFGASHLKARLVVKSLACLELLKKISSELDTQRFMVFHVKHIQNVLDTFIDADILLGKPIPIQAIEKLQVVLQQDQLDKIQWLVDTPYRIKQFLELAKKYNIQFRLNIELDVGLHRGGVENFQVLGEMLDLIALNPKFLQFSGFMGYDAHVTKVPEIIKKSQNAYAISQQLYQEYIDYLKQNYSQLMHDGLCFNGGGSPTFGFHVKHSVCNDLSFGSMLLKPSDFDHSTLNALLPALWIATPVLKVLEKTQLPSMGLINKLPQLTQAVFIYGGYWMAQYIYPKGSQPHRLYGRSSNQELVCIPKKIPILVDDYIFLRPTQSEAIIPQFECSSLYTKTQTNKSFESWENFRD